MSEAPNNWVSIPLGEIVQLQKGKKPFDLGPLDSMRNIPYINIAVFEGKPIKEYAPSQQIPRCEISDTLLVWDGARAGLCGRGVSGFIGSTLMKVTSDVIAPSYLYYFLHSQYGTLNTQTKGVGIPHIDPVVFNGLDFSLPPLNEQTRIVEKLEELLSDLDAGVNELKTAQKKLGQYRQSLLKAAVEGVLTADWRSKNTVKETGAQLLQRILKERRARWETKQLAKYKEQNKTPPTGWKEKYPEPLKPETADLPELAEGWVWASLEQLTEFITSGSRGWADYYSDQGAIFIRSQNINKDLLDLSDIAFVNPPKNTEGARTRVQNNDLLLTVTGANVGKAARVDVELDEAYVSQHVALIRPFEIDFSEFIHLFLTASSGGRGQLNKQAYGAGKPGLNLQQVGAVTIPLPSKDETKILMETMAIQLEAIAEQGQSNNILVKQSAAQRKNILKAAFSGQLVPQNPNDEPASVLLERIRNQRLERAKQPKPAKINTKKEIATVTKKLIEVLTEANDWISAQEAFRRCGIAGGTETAKIEAIYDELRALDKSQQLMTKPVIDEQGRKLHDLLKLVTEA